MLDSRDGSQRLAALLMCINTQSRWDGGCVWAILAQLAKRLR